MNHQLDLRPLQESVLKTISTARDEIALQFSQRGKDDCPVDQTLKRLFEYMSERSQAASYLGSSGYWWDAEIILRSCCEACAKIWLICLANEERRSELVDEFWGDYASGHNRRRANHASVAAELSKLHGEDHSKTIFDALTKDEVFSFDESNRRARKVIQQRWSFTEIVKVLSERSPESMDLKHVSGMLFMYGMQSHLIHADETALDLMLDRKLRAPNELTLLKGAHITRILSDQVSLWTLSVATLSYRYTGKMNVSLDLKSKYDEVHEIGEPISALFHGSQDEFYSEFSNNLALENEKDE